MCYTLPPYTVLLYGRLASTPPRTNMRRCLTHPPHYLNITCSSSLQHAAKLRTLRWNGDSSTLYTSSDVCYTLPPYTVLVYARLASTPPRTNMRRCLTQPPRYLYIARSSSLHCVGSGEHHLYTLLWMCVILCRLTQYSCMLVWRPLLQEPI